MLNNLTANYWPTFTPPQWPGFTPPLTSSVTKNNSTDEYRVNASLTLQVLSGNGVAICAYPKTQNNCDARKRLP
jgi:hypothetical protein